MQTSSASVERVFSIMNSGFTYTSKKNQLQDHNKQFSTQHSMAIDHKYNVIEGALCSW